MEAQRYLARAAPHMLAAKAEAVLLRETGKGCGGEICPSPVALEPPYELFNLRERPPGVLDEPAWVLEAPADREEFLRVRIWVSPEQSWDWKRCELMLKLLAGKTGLYHRAALEIVGNQEAIHMRLLCHRFDFPVVRAAFAGQFELCALTVQDAGFVFGEDREWGDAEFLDFFPPPPYSHLMTMPLELQFSPLATVFSSLAALPKTVTGLYQVVFQPVQHDHDWHSNVGALLDLEYRIKLLGGGFELNRFAQEGPTGDRRHMAMDLETKSHNDKPFFAAALRIAVAEGGTMAQNYLRSLAVIAGAIQHGGQPLQALTRRDYLERLGTDAIGRMLCEGLTFRAGFIVNSAELSSLAHLVPPSAVAHLHKVFSPLETLPSDPALSTGTRIGTCESAGQPQDVCIPEKLRDKHAHIIGGTGTGKSTLDEHMVLQDIQAGHGVAVLDPHGPLVQRLLCLVPREHADRVIYFDPGDPKWIPLWNPLACADKASRSRVAEDLIRAFKSFIDGWGDRLEHLLRHALFAVMHLPDGCMLDVSNLLRKKSRQSASIRALLPGLLENQYSATFWEEDFNGYGQADLSPPQHKLSKLLGSETIGAMLSQGESALDFRQIMDTGKILLADLSNVGSEARSVLGCFVLSLLHLTALGRNVGHATASPFHIYCDEAHRFVTDALEDLISEARKFGVSLTLAHQYMSQFGTRKADALSTVTSTVIFRVDRKDALYLQKDLQGKVELDDLSTLEVGHAIARIGNHVVRVHTDPPRVIPAVHCRDRIIARSRKLYCRPYSQLVKLARMRYEQQTADGAAMGEGSAPKRDKPPREARGAGEALTYDTF